MVPHFHMPGEQDVVGENIVIPHHDIVPDVAADHEEIVVSDQGGFPFVHAAVNGDVLANPVVITKDHVARQGDVEGDGLGVPTDDGGAADSAIFPNDGACEDLGVGLDPAALADHRVLFNDGERADRDF
jgi:hypothetical protein